MDNAQNYIEELKDSIRWQMIREGKLKTSFKDMSAELLEFRRNIFRPEIQIRYYPRNYKVFRSVKLGTFLKPIARSLAYILRKLGYQVRLRGRGMRNKKYHNSFTRDIKVRDSLFLAIYADKKLS